MRQARVPTIVLFMCLLGFGASGSAVASCGALDGVQFRPLAGKQPINLCERYEGQVLLVVNTASKCGFTPQYEGLESLHQRLSGRGFAVLGFPSGDFMDQEFEDEQKIAEFCTNTYAVKFPMFEKIAVKGEAAVPFFKQLAEATGAEPGWNFHKYLIDREGRIVSSYGSRTSPDDPALLAEIEKLLAQEG
jgi:glutathione peroxidase